MNGSTPTVTGNTNTAETAALTGLTPNTEYYFQIKAVNSVTTTYGAVLNFTTTELPARHHERGHQRHRHSSTLNGSVNAENSSTSVSFCYSTTSPTNCSGATAVTASPATATGTSSTTESAALSGLAPAPSTSSRSRRPTASAPPMARSSTSPRRPATDTYSYAAGTGSGTAPAGGSGLDGTTIVLAANTFSEPGYTFAGWSDGNATYAAGATYTLASTARPSC